MGKILIIDDELAFTDLLDSYIREICPLLKVEICNNPLTALVLLKKGDNDLIIIDLEMPTVVILSARDPEYLREFFPMGSCLAVLNKFEARQKEVLGMILKSIQSKLCN